MVGLLDRAVLAAQGSEERPVCGQSLLVETVSRGQQLSRFPWIEQIDGPEADQPIVLSAPGCAGQQKATDP